MGYTRAPEWTGDVVRDLHINGITIGELARHLGITGTWAGKVLHGQKTPAGAEERFKAAVAELVSERS